MQLAHKIRLNPTNKQATHFKKACGVSRLSWNWGVSQWDLQYKEGLKPSGMGLKKEFNAVKKEQFPTSTRSQNMLVNNHLFNYKRLGKSISPTLKQKKAQKWVAQSSRKKGSQKIAFMLVAIR